MNCLGSSYTVSGTLFVVMLCVVLMAHADCPLPSAGSKCKPLPTSCDLLIGQIKTIKECLLKEIEETKICIESLNPCDKANTISVPTVITQSGYYCLIKDLDVNTGPAIRVNSGVSNVVIDLNSHTVTGTDTTGLIDVVGNSTDIKVINGIVKPLGPSTTGIRIQDSSNVALSNVVVEGNNNETIIGIHLINVTGFTIDSCSITKIGSRPLLLGFFPDIGCEVGKVTRCNFFDNNTRLPVVTIFNCRNIFFEDVDCSNNESPLPRGNFSDGFRVEGGSSNIIFSCCKCNNNVNRVSAFQFQNSSDCLCQRCEANQNVRNGANAGDFFGFSVRNSSEKIIFDSCIANNNRTEGTLLMVIAFGFFLNLSGPCCLTNCLAKHNEGTVLGGVGFAVRRSNAYLLNNIAIGNTRRGYEEFLVVSNTLFGNYAEANGTNYSVSTNNAPRFTYAISTGTFTGQGARLGGTVTGWDNIDAIP